MGFELVRLVREAAGGLGSIVAEKARDLRRRAHAQAGRVWQNVEEILRVQLATAFEASRESSRNTAVNQAVGPRTHVLIETMAEVLSLSGYRSIHADVAGFPAPQLIQGTVRSHRPSLTAVGGDRPVLVDVYLPGETDDDEQVSRWQLFASAAVQSAGEFHVVVPSWIEGSTGRAWVHGLTEATGMTVTKVWEI